MSKKKQKKDTIEEAKPCFVLTLPLRDEPWQHHKLDAVFQLCNKVKNCLIADRKKALEQMERTRQWKTIQNDIRNTYIAFENSNQEQGAEAINKELEEQLKPLFAVRNKLTKEYGFSNSQFQKRMLKYTSHYKRVSKDTKKQSGVIPSQTAQKIASEVWTKFEAYLYGDGKEIKFSKWEDFKSIKGKTNETGIMFILDQGRYWDSYLYFNDMRITVDIDPPWKDRYGYQEECLKRAIKFAGISRRWYPEGWRYFVQLTLDGVPPIKVNKETGKVLHPIGVGPVGHDIGTQTLASCGANNVSLFELADKVKGIDRQLRIINRAMDRSRRATNPEMFDNTGQVISISKLPPDCLTKDKKHRKWQKSKRYLRLESLRRSLYREQRETRLQQHNEMANKLLGYGNEHYIETMRFQALAKRAKETKKTETGKCKCKKRFGKSISNKAPATMVNILRAKVIRAGGTFHEINTVKAKASQYNHLSQQYTKKALSKRWNDMPDGNKVQRDIYSAFLLMNTNSTLDGFVQEDCEKSYSHFLQLHDTEITRISNIVMPSSAGLGTTA